MLRRGSQGVVSTACTDELMAKLSGDCETFNHNLVANFNEAKETMQKNFMQLFKRTSKEKLPDSFLRSLPKWGKGATKLHQVFNKSINRKQTDTLADQKDAPFELIIQPEILQEIDRDIHMLIDDELKRCVGENGPIIRDMQKILMQVHHTPPSTLMSASKTECRGPPLRSLYQGYCLRDFSPQITSLLLFIVFTHLCCWDGK